MNIHKNISFCGDNNIFQINANHPLTQLPQKLKDAIVRWKDYLERLDIDSLSKLDTPAEPQQPRSNELFYFNNQKALILEELKETLCQSIDKLKSGELKAVSLKTSRSNNHRTEFLTGKLPEDIIPGSYAILLCLPNNNSFQFHICDTIGTYFITFPKPSLASSLTYQRYDIYFIANLTPFIRIYEACNSRSKYPRFLKQIISGDIAGFFIKTPSSQAKKAISDVNPKLNDSQNTAVAAFLDLTEGIQLLIGPPGTGKTTTITTLLKALANRHKRILVCTPSNKALQVIAKRFQEKHPVEASLLVVSKSKELKELEEISISSILPYLIRQIEALNSNLLELLDFSCAAFKKESNLRNYKYLFQSLYIIFIKICNYFPELNVIKNNFQAAGIALLEATDKRDFSIRKLRKLSLIINNDINNTLSFLRKTTESELLKHSKFIFTTLNGAGRKAIKKLGSVDVLIIDEGAQSTESEILIPFGLKPKKCLLVGDVNQLPPTVISQKAQQKHYDWSMMWRLIKGCDQPYHILNTQYRMQPQISQFPSSKFYAGALVDDRSVKMRDQEIEPYQILDVDSKEIISGKSRANPSEAHAVIKMIKELLRRGFLPSDISVITPYSGQADLIKALWADQASQINGLRINTIDSFQGEENEAVIISLVRANVNFRIGFLNDYRRLNVAITRPRNVLRVLCNGRTFNPFHPQNMWQDEMSFVLKDLSHLSPDQFSANLDTYWTYDDYNDAIPYAIQRFENLLDLENLPPNLQIGRFHLLMHPLFPKGTHLLQDILDIHKPWRNLSLEGLPSDTFNPISWTEITDVPCDDFSTYPASTGWYTEEDAYQNPLIFSGIDFSYSNLRGLDFKDSEFQKCSFFCSDVTGTKVNLEKMDVFSRKSFLIAQEQSKRKLTPKQKPLPAVSAMLKDAVKRNVISKYPAEDSKE